MRTKTITVTLPTDATNDGDSDDSAAFGDANELLPGSVYLQLTGAFDAHYVFEGSVDGVTWADMTATFKTAAGAAVTSPFTGAGLFSLATCPPQSRIRCTSAGSSQVGSALLMGLDTRTT